MPKDDRVYISHIIERSSKIIEFTSGMSESDFIKDEKTQSAVIRELEVIGEASKRISEDFRNKTSTIPWKLMAGMRDVLIHNYEGVDAILVWDTIQKSIPSLIEDLKKVI
jgi:uncharacterized protein with HEPN domain